MELFLATLLGYIVSLAANERTAAIHEQREKQLREQLEHDEMLRDAISKAVPIRDTLKLVANQVAKNRAALGKPTPVEKQLFDLLLDPTFQHDLSEWLMAGGIVEGSAVKSRLIARMSEALRA